MGRPVDAARWRDPNRDHAQPPADERVNMMIGVRAESGSRETRVAATPATVTKLVTLGYDVLVEAGAGQGSSFPDEAYVAAGAAIGTGTQAWAADVVLRVNAPSVE